VVGACGSRTPTTQSTGGSAQVILNTASAPGLVAAFTKAGLQVPNPHDVTQAKCPPIGCVEAIDSDTVSIIKFPGTGKAERFAGATPDIYLIEDIVLVFTPAVPASQRVTYEQIARRAVGS
jgi:hypothetical protein